MTLSIGKLLSLTTVSVLAGILIGQQIMLSAHDLSVLENNTLNFIQVAYVSGCTGTDGTNTGSKTGLSYEQCVKNSYKYRADITEIFHNKIWDLPAKRK